MEQRSGRGVFAYGELCHLIGASRGGALQLVFVGDVCGWHPRGLERAYMGGVLFGGNRFSGICSLSYPKTRKGFWQLAVTGYFFPPLWCCSEEIF